MSDWLIENFGIKPSLPLELDKKTQKFCDATRLQPIEAFVNLILTTCYTDNETMIKECECMTRKPGYVFRAKINMKESHTET